MNGAGYKPLNALEVRDIDGAYARRERDPRNTCPLVPQYKLPYHAQTAPPVNKFLRQSNRNEDISGAQVVSKHKHLKTRESLKVTDIYGAKGKKQTLTRTFGHAKGPLDHSDITNTKFRTKRQGHNPQNPNYTFGRQSDLGISTVLDLPAAEGLKATLASAGRIMPDQKVQTFGEIRGSRPTPAKQYRELKNRSFNLRTKDVPGATEGWTPEWAPTRTQWGKPTNTADIKGAQPGTKKKMRTNRKTNSLQPKYRMPGHTFAKKHGKLGTAGRQISQITLG